MSDDAYRERFAELALQLREEDPGLAMRAHRAGRIDNATKVAMFVVLHIGTALMVGGLVVRSTVLWLLGLGLTIVTPVAVEVQHRLGDHRRAHHRQRRA